MNKQLCRLSAKVDDLEEVKQKISYKYIENWQNLKQAQRLNQNPTLEKQIEMFCMHSTSGGKSQQSSRGCTIVLG